MGLLQGDFPPVDPAKFQELTYQERIKILSRHWAEYGFGAPKITMLIYIAKLVVLYVGGGILVATLTSGLDPFEPAAWWDEPIVWQKAVAWTMLLECLNLAGSWGPLAGKFKPMTGGFRYYARVGALRNPPWPGKVPLTAGSGRAPLDVALYVGLVTSLGVALALGGVQDDSLTDVVGENEGLMSPVVLVVVMVLLVTAGLRDKILFLAARSEQYLPALVFFAFFPFVDMVVAAKILIVMVWFGAGVSKLNRHFECVIPPMVSNTPWLPFKGIKRMHYADFPSDLRPSKLAKLISHGPGAAGELVPPLILLFSQNETLSTATAVFMVGYHVFIISTFPLAVPLEWNVLFGYLTAFLFIGFPNHEGFGLGDMETGLLVGTVAVMALFPVLGEVRPDLVSFLPGLRQYSGNWATAMWVMAPGVEKKLDTHIVKPAKMQKVQLTAIYGEDEAEVVLQQLLGWRSLHSQARGLNSVMLTNLGEDLDVYTPRDAEFQCNAITGFNFGDGHFHDQYLLDAIQERCRFAPGELLVVWAESEPIMNGRQQYWVWDSGEGIVERGSWAVKDAVREQPWLPNGPIALDVDWRKPGYTRVSHSAVDGRGAAATGIVL